MWTIIRFITRFFWDLWHATLFAVVEYDEKLKMTKTPSQRFLIWLAVAGITILVLAVVVMLIRQALYAINIPII